MMFPFSSVSYPIIAHILLTGIPFANLRRYDHFKLSDFCLDSSWATMLNIVKIISLFGSRLFIPSISKNAPTGGFNNLSCRTYEIQSRTFRAKRLIDFVTIRLILPALHSSIICRNCFLCMTEVPDIPSSAYIPCNVQFSWSLMYWV